MIMSCCTDPKDPPSEATPGTLRRLRELYHDAPQSLDW